MAWHRFLDQLGPEQGVDEQLAPLVREWWGKLSLADSRLPLPMAEMTADGERFQFAWSYSSLLLELEVGSDGSLHWFARDRIADRCESGVLSQRDDVSPDLLRWLEKTID